MKWPLGKNQTVGMCIFGAVFVASWWKIDTAEAWANFAMWFGPAAILAILGPAAASRFASGKQDE
jgi:hypothetical protein